MAPTPSRPRWVAAVAAVATVALLGGIGLVATSGDDGNEATADGGRDQPDAPESLTRADLPDAEPLTIVATTTATSFSGLPVGEPFQLIGSTAWTTNWSNVDAVDLATGETTTTPLAEGYLPSGTVVSPDQQTAWVRGSIGEGNDGLVFQVDLASGDVRSTTELAFRPSRMDYAAADQLVVLGSRDLVLLSTDGEVLDELESADPLDDITDVEATSEAIWTLDWTGTVRRHPLGGDQTTETRWTPPTTAVPSPDEPPIETEPYTTADDLATVGEHAVVATSSSTVDAVTGSLSPTAPSLVVLGPSGDELEIAVPSIGACTLLTDADGVLAMCGGEPAATGDEADATTDATIELWRVDVEAGTVELVDRRLMPGDFSDEWPQPTPYPGQPLRLYPTDDGDGPVTSDLVVLSVVASQITGQRLVGAFDESQGTSWLLHQADGVAGFNPAATMFWPAAD